MEFSNLAILSGLGTWFFSFLVKKAACANDFHHVKRSCHFEYPVYFYVQYSTKLSWRWNEYGERTETTCLGARERFSFISFVVNIEVTFIRFLLNCFLWYDFFFQFFSSDIIVIKTTGKDERHKKVSSFIPSLALPSIIQSFFLFLTHSLTNMLIGTTKLIKLLHIGISFVRFSEHLTECLSCTTILENKAEDSHQVLQHTILFEALTKCLKYLLNNC